MTSSAAMAKFQSPQRVLFGVVAVALAVMVVWQPYDAGYGDFRRTLAQTLMIYWRDPTWQHGALAPLIACWLVWRDRSFLAALPVRGSAWGLPLLLAAVFFYYAGFKANNFYFGVAAIQLYVAGAVLWVLGWKQAWRMLFPWLILCFTWPLLFLEDTIAFRLRLLMVKATSWVLQMVGVPAIVDGTALLSAADEATGRGAGEVFSLKVDGPCSGMRSLFALMMVSALFSYFRQPTWPRQLVLFAMSVPLAVVANLCRLLILLAASAVFGQDFAVGNEEKEVSTFHFASGLAVFGVALLGLEAASTLMNRLLPRVNPAGSK